MIVEAKENASKAKAFEMSTLGEKDRVQGNIREYFGKRYKGEKQQILLEQSGSSILVNATYFFSGLKPDEFIPNVTDCFYAITNLTYAYTPLYIADMENPTFDWFQKIQLTTLYIEEVSYMLRNVDMVILNVYLYGMHQAYLFEGIVNYSLAMIQNILGNVINFTYIGTRIERLAQSQQYSSLMTEYGTLIRLILFSARPVETKSLITKLNHQNSTKSVNASYIEVHNQPQILDRLNSNQKVIVDDYKEQRLEQAIPFIPYNASNTTDPVVKDFLYYMNVSYEFISGMVNGSSITTTPNFTDCQ